MTWRKRPKALSATRETHRNGIRDLTKGRLTLRLKRRENCGPALDYRCHFGDLVAARPGHFLYVGRVRSHSAGIGDHRHLDPSHSRPQTGVTCCLPRVARVSGET